MGFQDYGKYSQIEDNCLHELIGNVKEGLPHVEGCVVIGCLCQQGLFIQRRKIQQSIHYVEPLNAILRWNFHVIQLLTQFLAQIHFGI